ncbi:hypothetical protein PsorP6_019228 [Peronosclerospora sorghi]|nr:hypothetical protein PsorP6_019228 [Peronosclerospora sorghi]
MATVSVFFHEIIDTEEGEAASEIIDNEANYVVVPNSEFCVTLTAMKSNVSKYFINDKPSNFTRVTQLLQDKGINLDNNREVEQIAMIKERERKARMKMGFLSIWKTLLAPMCMWSRRIEYGTKWNSAMTREEKKVNSVKLVEKEKAHLEGPRAEAIEFLRKEKEVYIKTNILYQLCIQEA